jgi:predicted O-methyltransferase YrrM
MTNTSINSPQVTKILAALYADGAGGSPEQHGALAPLGQDATELDRFTAMRHRYMAVNPEFGNLLYALARAVKAKNVIEFGTSFGVSTIYLAAAVRDNGGGKVITTEFLPDKADRARQNLVDAGLEQWVEFRHGDARESLKTHVPDEIDMVFLDGAKGLYLDILNLVAPKLRSGGIVASDNTDSPDLANFLEHIRTPSNGWISSAIETAKTHEITVRL